MINYEIKKLVVIEIDIPVKEYRFLNNFLIPGSKFPPEESGILAWSDEILEMMIRNFLPYMEFNDFIITYDLERCEFTLESVIEAISIIVEMIKEEKSFNCKDRYTYLLPEEIKLREIC